MARNMNHPPATHHKHSAVNATSTTIASGKPSPHGNARWAMALLDIKADSANTGVEATDGQPRYTAATGADWTRGARLAYDDGNDQLVLWTPDSEFLPIGTLAEDKPSAQAWADVNLRLEPFLPYGVAHAVTGAEEALNSGNGRVVIDTGFGARLHSWQATLLDASGATKAIAVQTASAGVITFDGDGSVGIVETDVLHVHAFPNN